MPTKPDKYLPKRPDSQKLMLNSFIQPIAGSDPENLRIILEELEEKTGEELLDRDQANVIETVKRIMRVVAAIIERNAIRLNNKELLEESKKWYVE